MLNVFYPGNLKDCLTNLLSLLLHLIIVLSIIKLYCVKTRVKLDGSCLKQDKTTFTHGTIVVIYIVYEISICDSNNNYPTLENFLFGGVNLTKNADIDKYKYSGYVTGFERPGNFSFPTGGFGCNVIFFGVDMSSSVHVDNKKNKILILRIRILKN